MTLLYESNKDKLVSVACYTNDGNLVAASPIDTEKTEIDVTSQSWFKDAVGELENFHFSKPHVGICLMILLIDITGWFH